MRQWLVDKFHEYDLERIVLDNARKALENETCWLCLSSRRLSLRLAKYDMRAHCQDQLRHLYFCFYFGLSVPAFSYFIDTLRNRGTIAGIQTSTKILICLYG